VSGHNLPITCLFRVLLATQKLKRHQMSILAHLFHKNVAVVKTLALNICSSFFILLRTFCSAILIWIAGYIFHCVCSGTKSCFLQRGPHSPDGSTSSQVRNQATYAITGKSEWRGERMPVCSRNLVVGRFLADINIFIKKWAKCGPHH
jgi:hypothetical protein